MNLAKEGYSAYESSQQHGGNQGGNQNQGQGQNQDYNQNQNQGQGQQIQGGAQYNSSDNRRPAQLDYNHDDVVNSAAQHSGQDPSLFQHAISSLQGQQHSDVNEQELMNAHQQAYSQGNASNLSASSMGAAGAMQAFQHFTSGGGGSSQGSGSIQSQLISKAMAEAAQLFDKSGGASGGNKQDAVSSAGGKFIFPIR